MTDTERIFIYTKKKQGRASSNDSRIWTDRVCSYCRTALDIKTYGAFGPMYPCAICGEPTSEYGWDDFSSNKANTPT